MKTITPSPLLTFAFGADALVSGAVALLQLATAAWLGKLLQLPPALLLGTGLFLAGYTALLIVLARSRVIWSGLARFVALGNIGWAAGCAALIAAGLVTPGPLGVGFLLVQAVTVLVFAALQWMGLASSAPVMAHASAQRSPAQQAR